MLSRSPSTRAPRGCGRAPRAPRRPRRRGALGRRAGRAAAAHGQRAPPGAGGRPGAAPPPRRPARAGARRPRRAAAATPASATPRRRRFVAAFELGRRVASLRLRPGDPIRSPADVHRHFHPLLRDAPHERFLVVLLDGRHRVIRPVLTSQGTLTASLVHPREVFAPGAPRACRGGGPGPQPPERRPDAEPGGPGDHRAPRRPRASSSGIPVLDHVVVAEQGYVSLREDGALRAPRGS